MFIDDVEIIVKAGRGGDGSVAFRREKFIPRGGPWGGNGGNGGDVYIEAVDDIGVLRRYRNQREWKAESGGSGQTALKHGKDGNDIVLPVPRGTIVRDISGERTFDLQKKGQKILIAKGGQGGKGNKEFATATRQTPRFAEKGMPGQVRELRLELQLIADVGFIGLPNAGKSSLLNELTNASAKVGNYPFTTTEPNLGVADELILADIPGLIEGAAQGKGLGIHFLQHIRRTRVLAHCISVENEQPVEVYNIIRHELEEFDPEMNQKEEIIVLTKTDLVSPEQMNAKLKKLMALKKEVIPVSIHNLDQIQVFRNRLHDLTGE